MLPHQKFEVNGEQVTKSDLVRRVLALNPDMQPAEIKRKVFEEYKVEVAGNTVSQIRTDYLKSINKEKVALRQKTVAEKQEKKTNTNNLIDGLTSLKNAVTLLGGKEVVQKILEIGV